MDAERWQRLSPLLDAMFELDAATRARSLELLREEDPQLADDLAALIALDAERDDFLSQPLVAPLPGMRGGFLVGPYRLDRMLGEGGMGQVWLATRADGLYERRVALKLLRPGLADPKLRLRFTRERQILARLEHPHIARLLDAGISNDQPYLALEYVDGEPITDWCRAHALPLDARLRLFLQTCEAVSHAHANLIVHRDLKPSNILVTPLDEVRLLDFGIAKLLDIGELAPDQTRTGLRTFTLHYAAPEQIRGEPVTTMTDVYSLGVVLYELLTDARPYRLKRPSDAEWEEAILTVDPARPSQALLRSEADTGDPHVLRRRARALSGDLDNIVLKALGKRPEQRYPSVEALALDLQRFREGKPVQARPQSMRYRARKYLHRHRWALATVALVTLVLSTALGIVAWQARQAVQEASRAQALQDFVVGLFEHAGDSSNGRLDVRQLLEAGARRGSSELARQPAARAELFGVIARLRLGLGDYREALQLLNQQASIIAVLGDDAPPGLRLQSVTDRGRAQRTLGQASLCVDAMRRLAPLAQRVQQQLPLQAAEFYSQLGRCRRDAGQAGSARQLFERALALRGEPLNDGVGASENMADLAGLDGDAGDTAKALRGTRAALAKLRASAGPRQPFAVDLLRSQCALERSAGAVDMAARDCRAALALALSLHGASYPIAVDARRQLAAILVDQGHLREAEAAYRDTRAWLVARVGPTHASVAKDDNSLGIIAWERGDTAAALRWLDQSIAIRRSGVAGSTPLDLAGVLFNKAMVLHDSGDDAGARPLLAEALQLRAAALHSDHPLVGDTQRLLGEVDAGLGDRARARGELQSAVDLTRSGYGYAHPHTRRAELSLAAFDAAGGDAAALHRLDALAQLPAADSELRKVAWLAAGDAAAVRCHGPQRAQALSSLQALDLQVRETQPEGGVIPRRLAHVRAGCGAT
jgi:serine/threonine-protein kinase